MTLDIAAQGKEFVVLGSDSRGTIQDAGGNRIELSIQIKLVKITKNVGVLLFGAADQANYIIEKFKSSMRKQNYGVTKIAEDFAEFCRSDARNFLNVPATHFPQFGFIIAGIDKSGRKIIPRCYNLLSATGFRLGLKRQGFDIQGKPLIANYLFAKNYHQNLTVDELCQLVAQALHDTMNIDGDVGGKIRLAVIDESGMRKIPSMDIEGMITKWKDVSI